MPRLPAPEDYGMSSPSATRGISTVTPVQEKTDLATGKAMMDIGAMMAVEADRMDETVAQDALNKLQEKQLDLSYGEQGFTKLQGKAVIDGKVTSAYPEQLKQEAERLRAGISGTKAATRFDAAAAGVMQGFKVKAYTHAAKETETYHQQTFKGVISNGVKAAETGAWIEGVSLVLPALEAEIRRQGMDGEAADQFRREAMGPIYSTGIKQLLISGKSGEANELLANSKPYMTPQQVDHFSGMVKTQSDYDMAGSLVDQARLKNLNAEQAYDFFREQAKGNKEVSETAKGLFNQYAAAKDRDEAKTQAPVMLSFLEDGGNQVAMASALRSPGYINAPPEVQVKIRDYMTSHVRSAIHEARSEEAYWESKKFMDPGVMIAFQNIAGSPETLVKWDDAQIYTSMLPLMGKTMTAKLIAYKHEVAKAADGYKIPRDLIDQAKPPELLAPKTKQAKEQKERFEGLITEALVDWRIKNPGRVPTREQEQGIVLSATRKVTQAGSIFGTNEVPAYDVKPVPPDFRAQAIEHRKKKNQPPPTEEEIFQAWALQKASR